MQDLPRCQLRTGHRGDARRGIEAEITLGRRCCRGPTSSRWDSYADDVLFYGVVSARTEKVVEFFLERETAEAMIGEVREDEPELADELRIEEISLVASAT